MSKTDTPGVIAPPPLIYLGFLFVGWGLAELGARPEAVEAGYSWLAAGFGLEMEVRRGLALTLIIGGLLLDGMAAGLFRRGIHEVVGVQGFGAEAAHQHGHQCLFEIVGETVAEKQDAGAVLDEVPVDIRGPDVAEADVDLRMHRGAGEGGLELGDQV